MTSPTPSSEADVADEAEPPAAEEFTAAGEPAGAAHSPAEASTPKPSDTTGQRSWVPRLLRVLRVAALVIALPIAAFALGLVIAWIVHEIRGDHVPSAAGSGSAATVPTIAPSAAAKPTPPPVTVPADWVVEAAPPLGLTYRHPADWIRRTATPEVLRFAPAAPGSSAPGIEAVGAGIEPAASPADAARNFATRNYGGQPGFASTTPVAVISRHPGELQTDVTYRRSGVDVRVVIHSYRVQGKTVLVLGRAASAQPARAGQLEAFVEASLSVSG